MLSTLFFIVLSLLGVSFLIFIHELGHYWMARRVGMRVETFSIGFGPPIVSWQYQGATWQIGWLPFGGFVKIAGSELDKEQDPYEVKDGFFGATPLNRIKVAIAGPLANLLFALLAFNLLWTFGGRAKSFSEYTKKIGWVDPASELYTLGVRPGDEITAYDGRSYEGVKDHLYAAIVSDGQVKVQGFKVDYANGEKTSFEYSVKPYPYQEALEKGIQTIGITQPASYMIYKKFPGGVENPLPEGSGIKTSGLKYGDRIIWVEGALLFSIPELNYLINGSHALLTIQREGKTFLARVPRVAVQELRPDTNFREELTDWQFAASLKSRKTQELIFIPYNLNNEAVVEGPLKFIDKEKEAEVYPASAYTAIEESLKVGDKIIAINGKRVQKASELLEQLQNHEVLIIVERGENSEKKSPAERADADFNEELEIDALNRIVNSIGTDQPIFEAGKYLLLKPVMPKATSELFVGQWDERVEALEKQKEEHRKALRAIENPTERAQKQKLWDKQEKRLLIGVASQDRKVEYNPSPIALFGNVMGEIFRTLDALISGNLNPKWMAGPVGIVHMVHTTSTSSLTEALYWLGAISINLGILNLLPVPVLDGGTILMSLFELVTRQRIKPKVMEKLVIPFALGLMALFVYLTYNDLMRIISQFFK